MSKTISTEKLQRLRKSSEGFVLIDVMPREGFDKDHIPGARNVPLGNENFAADVQCLSSGSKTRRIVLYGDGPDCDASSKAVRILVEDGFTNVFEYEGGLTSWNESQRARPANGRQPDG